MEAPEITVDLSIEPIPAEVAQLAGESMEQSYEDELSELASLDEGDMWRKFDELLDAALDRAYDVVTVGTEFERL